MTPVSSASGGMRGRAGAVGENVTTVFLSPNDRDDPRLAEAKRKMAAAILRQYEEVIRLRALNVDVGVFSLCFL